MLGVLLTVGMLGVMGAALLVVARFWPRSSRRTGYRISGQDTTAGEAPPIPEDDDARWNWRDRLD
jgi:hypothetical protein